ncbi:MAG: hypothetical protein KO464_05555 [Candidatus Methanofastidiosum sp.]|nr:hypothetical protein [Methanofastidiosum sp.]
MTPSKNVMTDIAQEQGKPELQQQQPEQQSQEPIEQLDQAMVEKIKEALKDFNVRDINPGPDKTVTVVLAPYEPNFVENAQYYLTEFTLAAERPCPKTGKTIHTAIGLTPGRYKAKDGTYVTLSAKDVERISPLFRNKPLRYVDHDLATPESTHEGPDVGTIVASYYEPSLTAMMYDFLLDDKHANLDLSMIGGSSPKVAIGDIDIADHIAIIPKCQKDKKCFLPQDPNTAIRFPYRSKVIENAMPMSIAGGKTMVDNKEVAKALAEVEAMNKNIAIEKKPLVKQIVLAETKIGKCVDPEARIDELYSKEFSTLIVLAQDATKVSGKGTPQTVPAGQKKEISLAKKAESEDLLEGLIAKRLRGGA